jgi:hypothetical protein
VKYYIGCRGEFEDWATRCADCNTALVSELPPEVPKAKKAWFKPENVRPKKVIIFAYCGFVVAVLLFPMFFPLSIAYAFVVFKLLRLSNKARIWFIGFSVFLMIPFLLVFSVLISSFVTGGANVDGSEAAMWAVGFSILFFPFFIYHLMALIYFTRPKIKRVFK